MRMGLICNCIILAAFMLTNRQDAEAVPMDFTGWYTSEGCYVFGDTFDNSGDIEAFTTAVAFDYSPCNWVYLSGQYYAYPNWYGPVGPGWSYEPADGEYTYPGPGRDYRRFHSFILRCGRVVFQPCRESEQLAMSSAKAWKVIAAITAAGVFGAFALMILRGDASNTAAQAGGPVPINTTAPKPDTSSGASTPSPVVNVQPYTDSCRSAR